MDTAKQHWEILRMVPDDLARMVREFMVIGEKGDGVLLVTENGDGYWLGKLQFGWESKQATEPNQLDVPRLASMAHGNGHILLLNEDGQIHAMGENYYGQSQLGLGTVNKDNHFSPQLISSPHKFTSIRCGMWHSLALTKNGKVWAWGNNISGQVGVSRLNVHSHPFLHKVSELDPHRVVAIECGAFHSLALTDQGEVYVWGANSWGQLGHENGVIESRQRIHLHSPTQIPTLSSIKSIAAGNSHTLLLTQTGVVYACGGSEGSQLAIKEIIKFRAKLKKIAGLPVISQIASHFYTRLSIAMTSKRECFVWGHLSNTTTSASTPFQLPSSYSTLDSVLSFHSTSRNTPYSICVKELKCSQRTDPETQTELHSPSNKVANPSLDERCHKIDSGTRTELQSGPARLVDRIAKMFDNPDSNPDVKFKLGDQSILVHRSVLQISSDHFNKFFSKSSYSAIINPTTLISQSSHSPLRHTTNPSEPDSQINPIPHCQTSFTTIPIPDHCYPTFHAYLHFLYTGTLQVPTEHLADLFELAHSHLESDLSELCLVRMRSTLSPENCCLFYQLTERHSLPEFQKELVHFIADNIPQIFLTAAYQSMDGDLCKKLAISIANLRQ